MTTDKRRNPVLASLSLLAVLALYSLPFLRLAPNRLVSGQPIYLFSISDDGEEGVEGERTTKGKRVRSSPCQCEEVQHSAL